MKNLIKLSLLLAMMFVESFTTSASIAYDFEVDGVYYKKYNRYNGDLTVYVTYENSVYYGSDYNGHFGPEGSDYSGDIVIPETVNYNGRTYNVKGIGGGAFYNCTALTSIVIPSTVTAIDSLITIHWDIGPYNTNSHEVYYGAFQGCVALTSVEVPDGVTLIGGYAFSGCSKLAEISVPNSVKSIGGNAFSGCTSLTHFEMPNSVKTIGESIFSGCRSLSNVTLSESLKSISNHMFKYCRSLQNVTIPAYVTSIGEEAFYYCTSIMDVIVPDEVTTIGPYAFRNCTGLTQITIGASVESIGSGAFYDCSNLSTVVSLPLTPPSINYYTFYKVPSDVTVYVLPAALEAYQDDYEWQNYNIQALYVNFSNLTVNLPDDTDITKYTNMKLVIRNNSSDQTLHYIIGDKRSYTFANLDTGTVWNVSLINPYGDIFGKIDDVTIGKEDVNVTFGTLLQPQTVTLTVKTPAGQDVTEQVSISWSDESGELLKQGKQIAGLPAGRKLAYSVKLPQELATAYSLPADVTYTVKDGDNNVVCQLTAITPAKLSGKVMEATTNQPLCGASISATQTFAGGNTKTLTATTDNQGVYSFEGMSVPTRMTFAAPGYISQTLNCDTLMTGGNITMPDVTLQPITGAVINVNLTYTPAHAGGETAETQNWYSDYNNVDYEVYNKTTNKAIINISVQYPQIVLMEDVNDGDVLELTATSRKDAFNPVTTTVTVEDQKASATFNIVEQGKVAAKFNRNINPEVTGMLYNADGKLVKTADYKGGNLLLESLADGNYKLITMGKSEFFNSIYDLNQLSAVGLQAGTDYVESAINVKSGLISNVVIDEVPFFDESKLYYTGDNTSFTVNKPNIVIGNYLTFRAQVDFKEEYIDKISDVQLIIDLPASSPLYEGSVLVGNILGTYTFSGNRITIPLSNYNDLVRFCAIPTVFGNFAPSAFIMFKFNDKTITQPIGSALFNVEGLSSLIVPIITASPKISIGGTAYSNCQIDIYDNNVLIGHTTSNANSKWLTECVLYQPYNLSVHNIYANITTDQGIELPTQIVTCTYNNNSVQVSKVTQYNEQRGPTPYLVTWNFLNPSLSSQHYSYDMYDNHRTFSYTIEFTDNKAVSNVVLYVKTAKTGWWQLDATYDEEKDVWVTTGEFGDSQNADLPINVGVDFKYIIDSVSVENLVYAIANSFDHNLNDHSEIPEFNEDDFTVTQDQGQTIINFDGLQFDGSTVNSITIGDDISMAYSCGGINTNIRMSYSGVDTLPDDVYEYELNDSQSLFVTDTTYADTTYADTTYYITNVCYYYPISFINIILRTPYARQSHAFDSFYKLVEKVGTKHYVLVLESLKQKGYKSPVPPKPKDPSLDDALANCPELEPMVEAMRWRQEHASRLNDALDRFQQPFEWLSTILGQLGPLGEAAESGIDAANHAINAGQFIGNYLNGLHDNIYRAQFEAAGCIPPDRPPRPPHEYPGADQTFCIDPSGFVYEGVPSNRLQGVTATCYYKETVEDMYGDQHEEVVLWDAEQYGQENPLLTDENGYYRWDVPIGMWQVKYEKAGYETTYSDWLPVPPPQLDVNIGMVQMRQPEVLKAHAYPKAVELEFDKFMIPETLTTDNISVMVNGNAVSGTIELLNAEKDDPLAITSIRRAPGTGLTFASRVRFNADQPFNAEHVTLHVNREVESYAGLEMNDDYEVVLDIELEMQEIVADSVVVVPYLDSKQVTVAVLPPAASAGKVINVVSTSPMIASIDAEQYTLDSNGEAVITVHGDLPGMTSLLYSIDGYDLTASTLIDVKMESELTVATPTASIASGSEVESGTEVYLYCSTPGATIYYTLDGSCPCDPTPARMMYDGTPIIINSTVTIKAMATAPDLYDSDVATFVYRVRSGLKGDVNNDGEVNIADVNAVLDVILGGTISRADVNGDGEVNIADVNAIIDIILSSANKMRRQVNCEDLLHVNGVTMRPGDVRTLDVTVDHAERYSALQCDIVLPEGLTLVGVNGTNGHESRINAVDDETSRALTYSANKRPFMGESVPALSITVRADGALAAESQITLTNIVLADADNVAWHVADCVAGVNNASGIHDLSVGRHDRVWVEGRALCIETRQEGVAHVTTVNGIVHDVAVAQGVNRHEIEPGIYVVVLNGESHKIVVK